MPRPQIVISVHGGYVRDVFCSIEHAEVVLVDWDVEADDPTPDVVQVVDAGRSRRALVGRFEARPFSDLSGTNEAAAIVQFHRRPCAETVPT
jgi:hypothetical protein